MIVTKSLRDVQEDYLVVLKISASVNRDLFEKVREETMSLTVKDAMNVLKISAVKQKQYMTML